jgi:hypothetical protein
VERRPVEGVEAGNVGNDRIAERTGGDDQHGRDECAVRRRHVPALRPVIPRRAGDLVMEAEVRPHAELGRTALQVIPDLRLAREGVAPVRVQREGERVEMGVDVAGAAGVAVVAPGAADGIGALEHHEIVHALLTQADGEAEAAEPAPDDHDANLRGVGAKHVVPRGARSR